jgi:type II secretory pathway pseudopilin PulG
MTLIEITVVVAIIAMLVGFGLPAVRALINSVQSESVVRTMVQGVLDTARNLAMANQAYVGVRFQKVYDPTLPVDGQSTDQYMILVTNDEEKTGYALGYRAIEGHKPIRLPSQYYLTDLMTTPSSGAVGIDIASDSDVNEPDMTTFTVLFSATGQSVIREVRARNAGDNDRVFNTKTGVVALNPSFPFFLLDDDKQGRYAEKSRDRLYILDRVRLTKSQEAGTPWSAYLESDVLPHPIYVSPYNGQLIEGQSR